jgi:hypothetical protein
VAAPALVQSADAGEATVMLMLADIAVAANPTLR